jgi:hypothetical protein
MVAHLLSIIVRITNLLLLLSILYLRRCCLRVTNTAIRTTACNRCLPHFDNHMHMGLLLRSESTVKVKKGGGGSSSESWLMRLRDPPLAHLLILDISWGLVIISLWLLLHMLLILLLPSPLPLLLRGSWWRRGVGIPVPLRLVQGQGKGQPDACAAHAQTSARAQAPHPLSPLERVGMRWRGGLGSALAHGVSRRGGAHLVRAWSLVLFLPPAAGADTS